LIGLRLCFCFLEPSSVQAKFKNEVTVGSTATVAFQQFLIKNFIDRLVARSKRRDRFEDDSTTYLQDGGEREHSVVSHFRVGALRSR